MDEMPPGTLARRVMRAADRTVLATLGDGGAPYASLVLTALDQDATPILLISRLAQHTRNIEADPRVSVLFDGTAGHADPLTGARVTVMGTIAASTAAHHRERYLARYPNADGYAQFSDFAIHTVSVERAHLVAGFGRIHRVGAADLFAPRDVGEAIRAAEQRLVEVVNQPAHGLADQFARLYFDAGRQTWRACGIDCDGVDLRCDEALARLHFPRAAKSPEDAETMLRQPEGLIPA